MRSTSMTTPMLTLPYDALSEIALSLPAVGSTKPWRDVNSLATTCMRLYEWKKTVDNDVEREWNEVKKTVSGKYGWRDGLEIIISNFENSKTRLFREPILRKIASKRLDSDLNNQIKDFDVFVTMLYSMLEKISYEDIRQLLDVFNKASLSTKTQIVTVLPLFLPALNSKNRQQVLCQLFRLVDSDPMLRLSLTTSGAFNNIGNSLGDDHQSKILLMLSLYSRELLRIKHGYKFALDFIQSDERWSWVLSKVPEYLDTLLGMESMLDDPACRKQTINYLNELFLVCGDTMRLGICTIMLEFYSEFRKCRDGEKFVDQLIYWFLRSPEFCIAENGPLNSRFISVLSKHIAMYKTSLGKREKIFLAEKISKTISYAIRVKAYDQSTLLLIETAKIDKKLIANVCKNSLELTNKDALIDALLNVNSLKDLDGRYHYVSALCSAARYHQDSDPKFFKAFLDVRDAILMKM
jgi:hypothetical protein